VVVGLRGVARQAGPRSRPRHFDTLARERAAGVRAELLEVAAALERAADPAPDVLATLWWLLTDGCSSPLLNTNVPAEKLPAALDLVRADLDRAEAVRDDAGEGQRSNVGEAGWPGGAQRSKRGQREPRV
jgi:hypothetical protein